MQAVDPGLSRVVQRMTLRGVVQHHEQHVDPGVFQVQVRVQELVERVRASSSACAFRGGSINIALMVMLFGTQFEYR